MSESNGGKGGGGARANAKRWRRGLLAVIGVLYLVSVPWYRETGGEYGIVFGLPDWVAVAVVCYVAVAVLNAIAWQFTEVADPGENEPGDDRGASA